MISEAQSHVGGKATYYQRNRERIKAAVKARYRANRDVEREKRNQYYVTHKAEHAERCKRYATAHSDSLREYHTKWQRKYRANDPEANRERARVCNNRRYATPRGSLDGRMSCAIRKAIGKAKRGRSWESLVGYTTEQLHTRIESQFKPGMNWERFLAGQIEIDHIIPKTKFSYISTSDAEFRRCWALENLQPMWARPNLLKSNKILCPSQIPLGV